MNLPKCDTKFCRGRVLPTSHSPYCSKCRSRRFKQAHPLKYSFIKLRARARERGHDFALTFGEYEQFAITTGYAEQKGKTALSLSINRKNPAVGYVAHNIEAVTLSQNSRLKYAPLPDWMRAEMEQITQAHL